MKKIILFCTSFVTVTAFSQKIQFKDKNFEKVILERYDKNKDGFIDNLEYPHITTINLKGTELSTYEDIYQFQVRKLFFEDIPIKSLVLKNIPTLRILSCTHCSLTKLELENLPGLISVNINNNKLTDISIKNCPKIYSLSASRNLLKALDTSVLNKLEDLHVSDNNLQSLNLQNLSELNWLTIDNNHIKKLDISQNTKLTRVSAVGNNLNNSNIIKAKNTQHAVKIDLVEEPINNQPPPPPPPSVR